MSLEFAAAVTAAAEAMRQKGGTVREIKTEVRAEHLPDAVKIEIERMAQELAQLREDFNVLLHRFMGHTHEIIEGGKVAA